MLRYMQELVFGGQAVVAVQENSNADENIVEDDWVAVNYDEETGANEAFDFVEQPEIYPLEEDEAGEEQVAAASPSRPKPDVEAIRRREVLNKAKARTASRKHLEEVMFADPISGKDVRFSKPATPLGRSLTSNVVRRVNAQSGTQRAKKSSGKSNDRKVHRAVEIFSFPDV